VCLLAATIAPDTPDTDWISNFERGNNLLQNGTLHFVFR